jgi:putative salt-induced outer membrane protein
MKHYLMIVLAWSSFCSVSLHAAEISQDTTQPPPLWESTAETSVLVTSGNTDVATIGLAAASAYRPDPWSIKGNAAYLTSRSSGAKTAESYDAALRGERKISQDLSLFLSAAYLKNEFTGFKDRIGSEVGLGYLIYADNWHSISSEIGAGVIRENLISGVSGTALGSRTFINGRAAAEYKWKISETAEFSDTVTLLENLATTQDWRLSNLAAVTAMMTQTVSLKVSFRVDHLNQPVTGKKATDTTTAIALIAKF